MSPRTVILVVLVLASAAIAQNSSKSESQLQPPAARIVDFKTPDGIVLKGTYFAAAKPGPGVLLFHQSNRTRTSWDDVAHQLAAAGINTLTVDSRAHGESGGTVEDASQKKLADLETAFQFLISQPGVQRDVIGLAGAGSHGVVDAVETARLHPSDIKSLILVLMSGETFRPGIEFLHQASQLPELFVVADTDEYPPTVEAMLWLYARASSPSKKLIHYPAAQEAPWLWYETSDASKVAAMGGHGTDLFRDHPDLPGIIVQWFVTTLIKTPGHAPKTPKCNYGQKSVATSLAAAICARARPRRPSRFSNSTCLPIPTRLMPTGIWQTLIRETARKSSRGSMHRKLWRYSILTLRPHPHGPILSSAGVRFARA